jgi:hypothetical protein
MLEIVTVDVAIPIDDAAAQALQADPIKREGLGWLISHWLQPDGQAEILLDAMDRLSAHAEAKGLTEAILDEERATYNRERRG